MNSLSTISISDNVAIVTLNRPEQRNALSTALIRELIFTFQHLATQPNIRCVILTGNGSAFCAGMDLAELQAGIEAPEADIWHNAQILAQLYELIYHFPYPTIAALNGHAVAGGAGLASVCDLAVSVPETRIGYPEVRRGLVAAMVLPHLLRLVGERTARYWLLTGELFAAKEAFDAGFLNAIVEPPELLSTARKWASWCCQGGPKAIQRTKHLLNAFSPSAQSITLTAHESAEPRLGTECKEGLKAFFDKTVPSWYSPMNDK
ncbi:MAG: enoyl-CoA hydratase/isomerase family protein [Zavarzinella sp.]